GDGGVISGNVLWNDSAARDDGPLTFLHPERVRAIAQTAVQTFSPKSYYTYDPETYVGLEHLTPGTYTDTFSYTAQDSHGDTSTRSEERRVGKAARSGTAGDHTKKRSDGGGVIGGNLLGNHYGQTEVSAR